MSEDFNLDDFRLKPEDLSAIEESNRRHQEKALWRQFFRMALSGVAASPGGPPWGGVAEIAAAIADDALEEDKRRK